jgi:small subunit ribosomal protein S11
MATEAKKAESKEKDKAPVSKGSKMSQYALKKRKKKGEVRHVSRGRVTIKTSYNNTIIAISDLSGNVFATASAGMVGFSGAKKATPYAAGMVAKKVLDLAKPYGLSEVDVYLRGIGVGREAAIRGMQAAGIEILSIKDITPVPHNGCRPPKPRKV